MVSLLDLSRDPVSEWLANYGGSHVAYPLFWKTLDLLMFLREVLEAYWVIIEKGQDIFDRECLILRHINLLDLLLFDGYGKKLIISK